MIESYVSLDLETTGLSPKKDRILEIGAVRVENGRETQTYTTLINPRMEIPRRITELTGISGEMTAGMPEAGEAVKGLIEFCDGMPLVGHHIIFDYSFVKHCAVNQGLSFEKEGVDTLKLARRLLPDLPAKGLQYLREYFGIAQEQAHRALGDARSTYLLFERLKKDFGNMAPELFAPRPLVYQVKKQSPITNVQKRHLQELAKCHRIDFSVEVDSLTRNEASRVIDNILSSYGKIMR